MLNRFTLRTLKEEFEPEPWLVLDMPYGISIDHFSKDMYASYMKRGHTIALIEERTPGILPATVVSQPHYSIQGPLKEVVRGHSPLWARVIHDRNKSNQVQGILLKRYEDHQNWFNGEGCRPQ
jgi:hypothetical protein